MSATHLPEHSLDQIYESTIHPVQPEHTSSGAKGGGICLDHAERSMDRPEDEKYDEQVMCEPESFVVTLLESFERGHQYRHQHDQHDISGPSWASGEVRQDESFETLIVLGSQLCEIVPVGGSMDPGKQDNRISDQFMERDVLVKLDYTIERSLPQQRDQGSAYGEEKDCDVEMKNQRCCACD